MTTSLAPNSRTTECDCKSRATHADVGTHATPTTRKLQHNTNNMGANCSTNPPLQYTHPWKAQAMSTRISVPFNNWAESRERNETLAA